jgi:hypothetical protein
MKHMNPFLPAALTFAAALTLGRRTGLLAVQEFKGGMRFMPERLAPSTRGLPMPSRAQLARVRPGLDQVLYAPVHSVDDLYAQLAHTRIPIYSKQAVTQKNKLVAGRKWKKVPSKIKRQISLILAKGLQGYRQGSPRTLLGSSTKVAQGGKRDVLTAQMFLSPPGDQSGVNLCSMAGECANVCIIETGNLATNKEGRPARIAKTLWFHLFPEQFLAALDKNIESFVRTAQRQGKQPALRLNGTSDVLWERYGVPQRHPNVQMYDYTKLPVKARATRPSNYHLTYSFSEQPQALTRSLEWLKAGGNVAVVVAAKGSTKLKDAKQASAVVAARKIWEGYPTTSADADDIRFWDPPGHWSVLYAKGPALRDQSGFVVRVDPMTGDRRGKALLGLAARRRGRRNAALRSWDSREGVKSVVGTHPNGMLLINVPGRVGHILLPPGELEDEIDFDTRALASQRRTQVKSAAQEAESAALKAAHNETHGFAERLSPRSRARAIAALNKLQGFDGKYLPRREAILGFVKQGAKIDQQPPFGRVLRMPSGSFWTQKDLTKTGMDFASYMIASRRQRR